MRPDAQKRAAGADSEWQAASPYSDQVDANGHQWHLPSYAERWIADWNADPQRRARHVVALERIMELLQPFKDHDPLDGLRFLDLGCGWGNHTIALLNAFPGSSVVALDHSQAMLDHCEQAVKPFGSRVRLVRANLNEVEWNTGLGGPFDVVISVQTFHHVERSRFPGIYRDIAASLKDGGVFLNLDRFLPHLRAALVDRVVGFGAFRLAVEHWFPRWKHGASGIQHRQMLRDAGFEVTIEQLVDANGVAFAWLVLARES